jgi:hypothetical protein
MTADSMVIASLAESEARLIAENVTLTSMAESYRTLALVAVSELHRVTSERDTARSTVARLREEIRRYTSHAVAPDRAA